MAFEGTLLWDAVSETWEAMFDLSVEPSERPLAPRQRQSFLTGVMQIGGEWFGAVTIDFSPEHARRLSALVHGCDPASVTIEQMRDVLGEVVNIVGGSLKQALPPNCALSLPTLVVGLDYRLYIPGAKVLHRVDFTCDGEPLQATLFEVQGTFDVAFPEFLSRG